MNGSFLYNNKVCFILVFFVCKFSLIAFGEIISKLEIYDIKTNERVVIREFKRKIEAPNWSPDGRCLVYNSEGKLYRLAIDAPQSEIEIECGYVNSCNNDHLIAASGTRIAVSHQTAEDRLSRIYILPDEGGCPTLITALGPSYLHGWSPDEKMLTYCAKRKDNYDVYAIPSCGGIEKRLTIAEGLDDGPEFSPDGQYIWFNSVRSGLMQIWRMRIDGSEQTQMTFDPECNLWFPHISPDGSWIVFLSYKSDDVIPEKHPAGKHVELKLMSTEDYTIKTIVHLFGGQGTINVNSWSPDSNRFAFVSYVEE